MLKSKNYHGNDVICEYDSKNLKKSVYNLETKNLLVIFSNSTSYLYQDIPHETFAELNLAESQGKYFSQNIAKKFGYKKIEEKSE